MAKKRPSPRPKVGGVKPKQKAPRPRAPVVVKQISAPAEEMKHIVAHARMLEDPCNARLSACVGRGDAGIMQRFSSSFTIGTTASTGCGFLVYVPGANIIWTADALTTSTATTAAYGADTKCPGYTMLNTNSANLRAVASCFDIMPLASESARSGWCAAGNVAAQLINQGGSFTVDGVSGLLPVTSKIGDGSLTVKWSPGSNDDLYSSQGTLNTNTDNNVMVFVWGGAPAGVGFRVRVTTICEWRPRSGMGIVDSATEVAPTRATLDDVKRFLSKKDANWWWETGKTVFSMAKTAASFAALAL